MMKSYRGNAIAVGVLFIVCSVASILSIVPLGARVGAPVDFAMLAGSADAVVMTALIEFVWVASGMGVGALLSLVAYVYAGFTQDFGFTTVNDVLSAPIGLQEMVLAVWLIARGFNLSALSAVRSIAPPVVRSTTP